VGASVLAPRMGKAGSERTDMIAPPPVYHGFVAAHSPVISGRKGKYMVMLNKGQTAPIGGLDVKVTAANPTLIILSQATVHIDEGKRFSIAYEFTTKSGLTGNPSVVLLNASFGGSKQLRPKPVKILPVGWTDTKSKKSQRPTTAGMVIGS